MQEQRNHLQQLYPLCMGSFLSKILEFIYTNIYSTHGCCNLSSTINFWGKHQLLNALRCSADIRQQISDFRIISKPEFTALDEVTDAQISTTDCLWHWGGQTVFMGILKVSLTDSCRYCTKHTRRPSFPARMSSCFSLMRKDMTVHYVCTGQVSLFTHMHTQHALLSRPLQSGCIITSFSLLNRRKRKSFELPE